MFWTIFHLESHVFDSLHLPVPERTVGFGSKNWVGHCYYFLGLRTQFFSLVGHPAGGAGMISRKGVVLGVLKRLQLWEVVVHVCPQCSGRRTQLLFGFLNFVLSRIITQYVFWPAADWIWGRKLLVCQMNKYVIYYFAPSPWILTIVYGMKIIEEHSYWFYKIRI